jgi:hypothetical protein
MNKKDNAALGERKWGTKKIKKLFTQIYRRDTLAKNN